MRWWLALLLLGATPAQAADWVRSVAQRGDFPLVAQGQAARIVTDPADDAVVRIAADDLKQDIGRVTGAAEGGAAQIVMEMVKQQGNLDVLHVPYKGSGPVMTDLMSGLVGSFFAPYTPLMGQINSGKLRVIAVSSEKRVPSMPNVPTLKESGIDVVMTQWYGLVAPKGTPQPIIDKITQAVKQAMQTPEVQRVYRADGAQESTLTGAAFREFVLKDIANYKRGVERGNLKVE